MCQPVSKIFIGFGLTAYHKDCLLVDFAEKKSKGICVLSEKNSRQFNEVILSQMDLFFIIKKVYEENQVFHFKDLGHS